jgi:protease-4
VYSDYFTQGAYYLATAADKIYFNPEGYFSFVGLKTQSVFLKNALEKLDIETTLVRRGGYKSAGEQFTEEGYSKANREQLNRLITTIWDDVLGNISDTRKTTPERLNNMADHLLIKSGYTALQYGLVDSLIYKDQVLDNISTRTGAEDAARISIINLKEYSKVPVQKAYKGLAKNKIAILYASGEIVPGEGDESSVGSDKFGRDIRKIRSDSSIKALVVRVNSPGGSAIASEVIWRELWLTKQVKPVVVSMGDVAASGGYYIACPADTILAQPNTITGSIGVFSMFLNARGFFNRYGITFDTEKTNQYADFMSGVRPPMSTEIEYWETQTDSIYGAFLKHVADGRQLKYGDVHAIAQGRIWSGIDAVSIGLVDRLGGLEDAVEIARNMAQLDEKFRIVDFPKQEDPFEKMLRDLTTGVMMRLKGDRLPLESEFQEILEKVRTQQGIMARLPFDITIY